MPLILIPTFFLYIFGLFNLLGMKQDLVVTYAIFGVLGIIIYLVTKKIGLHFFRINAKVIYWTFLAILIITYIIGIEAKGSRRWIDLYFFQFQPSEVFKIFFIIFLADMYSKVKFQITRRELFIKSFLYMILPTFIIFKQPDLGSSLVYVFVFFVMCLFSDIPKRYLLYVILAGALMVPIAWNFLHDYQQDRIMSFVNPHQDIQGTSYNMTQAIITSGSGQLFGRGLGLGKQSNLYFLPEFFTDFAFSSLLEQFGFVGGFVVIVLYIAFSAILLRKLIALYFNRDEQSRFKFFYILGFLSFMLFQAFVNMGMNMGIMPIAGITLPLISYGGSSLLTVMIGLALIP